MARPESIGGFVNAYGADTPAAIGDLAIGSLTTEGGEVTWTDPTFVGVGPIVSYNLWFRTPQGSGPYTIQYNFLSASPYTLEGLSSGTAYDMYLESLNAYGVSRASNVIQFTTTA